MAREKELFRANLERLDERFPDKEVLNYDDIALLLGKNKRTVQHHFQKYYSKSLCGISKTVIANALS